eukprot:1632162-Alexandrium_andersonii.AAC.1
MCADVPRLRISRLRTPSIPAFVGRFGICAQSGAECNSSELRGPLLRLFLGLRSSSSERLRQLCIFQALERP